MNICANLRQVRLKSITGRISRRDYEGFRIQMNAISPITSEALWVLALLPTEEIPALASDWLAQGLESQSLVELAICSPDESEDIRRRYNLVLSEFGCGGMSQTEALKRYAKYVSGSILTSELTPLVGARLVWRATLNAGLRDFHDLDAFIYAASEMEDRPQDRRFFEQAIRDEAKRWSDVAP